MPVRFRAPSLILALSETLLAVALLFAACGRDWLSGAPAWERANPVRPIPDPPLGLDEEIDALVAFMNALDSDLTVETPPTVFPQ
jgi:hypothetical protein